MLLALLMPSLDGKAADTVQLVKYDTNVCLDPEDFDPPPHRRRSGAKPITCTITSEGIDIPGVASNDIYLYEVYSEDGECLATFASESDFIAYIFATGQTIEIRLYTDGYLLRGFLFR